MINEHGGADLADAFEQLAFGMDDLTAFQRRKLRRDYHLTQALAELPDIGHWARCAKLADEIRSFRASTWPRIQYRKDSSEKLCVLKSHLFEAFRTGCKIPASANGIDAAVTSESGQESEVNELMLKWQPPVC